MLELLGEAVPTAPEPVGDDELLAWWELRVLSPLALAASDVEALRALGGSMPYISDRPLCLRVPATAEGEALALRVLEAYDGEIEVSSDGVLYCLELPSSVLRFYFRSSPELFERMRGVLAEHARLCASVTYPWALVPPESPRTLQTIYGSSRPHTVKGTL